jgi:C4-dicarboxylate-specific signal transduction histidine kinase
MDNSWPADGRTRLSAEEVHVREIKSDFPGSQPILKRLLEIARASVLAEMASGIAHELNQPLGAIATFAQAGEGIKRIRRLFEQRSPQRTRCQMPELIEELRPVLDILVNRNEDGVRVHVPDSAWLRDAQSSRRMTERWGSRICPPAAAASGFGYRSQK